MSKPAWPTEAELTALLTDAGLLKDTPAIPLQTYLDDAREGFERETERKPFLAATQTRYYDPPGPNRRRPAMGMFPNRGGGTRLDISPGALQITDLRVGYTSTYAGTQLVQGLSWYLKPDNAATEGLPYEWVEFTIPVWGAPGSVKITGTFGFASNIPAGAWNAVLFRAAVLAAPPLTARRTQGATAVQLGMNRFQFDQRAFEKELQEWDRFYRAEVLRYRRCEL